MGGRLRNNRLTRVSFSTPGSILWVIGSTPSMRIRTATTTPSSACVRPRQLVGTQRARRSLSCMRARDHDFVAGLPAAAFFSHSARSLRLPSPGRCAPSHRKPGALSPPVSFEPRGWDRCRWPEWCWTARCLGWARQAHTGTAWFGEEYWFRRSGDSRD